MVSAKSSSAPTLPRHGRTKGHSPATPLKKAGGRHASGPVGALSVPKMRALMKTVGAGMAESRKSGRATRFVLELGPKGRMRILRDDKASSESRARIAADGKELDKALAAARARGRSRAAEILQGAEMLSAEAFANLLGVSRVTVNAKRQKREVLGLDGVKRGFRFPSWQLDENGKPFAALPQLFAHLGGSAWTVYRFLVQHHAALDGLSAVEALKRGRTKQVIDAALGAARGDFA